MQHEGDWGGRPPWLQPRPVGASDLQRPGVRRYPQTPTPPPEPSEPLPPPEPPVRQAARQQAGTRALAAKQRVGRAAWRRALAALCLPGRYGLQLEGRHLLGTPFGRSLGSYSLHRGGVHARCRHLHGGTRTAGDALTSLRMSLRCGLRMSLRTGLRMKLLRSLRMSLCRSLHTGLRRAYV